MNQVPGIWKFGYKELNCSRPVIMGIINVTPDSFSDGGVYFSVEDALSQARQLVSEGADILDIGGESNRPGSAPVTVDDELARVIPVIEAVRSAGIEIPISIDTRKLEVARKALDKGVEIINDVSALQDSPELGAFIAENDLGVCLMHMQGRPRIMQQDPHYGNVISEIGEFFSNRLDYAYDCGIKPENIVLDPGIGFGKLLEHNLAILKNCGKWLELGHPILIGPSRKRFIGEITGNPVDDRVQGTVAACLMSMVSGARIFRVHDVGPVKQALDVAWEIMQAGEK